MYNKRIKTSASTYFCLPSRVLHLFPTGCTTRFYDFFKFAPAGKNLRTVESRGVTVLLLGFVCISFQCVPQFSAVVPSFFFLTFFHFLCLSILFVTSCVIHDLLHSSRLSQPNISQYLKQISSYCSTVLTNSYSHSRLYWVLIFLIPYIPL